MQSQLALSTPSEVLGTKIGNLKNSVSCLLKNKQLQKYKKEIGFDFLEGLEKKVAWIHEFKDSHDRLIHLHFHLTLATTKGGKLGYEVADAGDTSWGKDTVTEIFQGLKTTVDNLSDLIEYLSQNLLITLFARARFFLGFCVCSRKSLIVFCQKRKD